MSLFNRSSYTPFVAEPSFTPLFRLLDEFDNYSGGRRSNSPSTSLKTFQPKFDVKEVESAYELHGELPGIDQKDIEIEFVDDQTLSIRGRTERHYESGNRPTAGSITEGESPKQIEQSKQPAVEDDPNEPATPTSDANKQVGAKSNQQEVAAQAPASKYWVSERSIGEFARSFSFPGRVDQDAVKASMKDGILSIIVPKAKKAEGRKITVQ